MWTAVSRRSCAAWSSRSQRAAGSSSSPIRSSSRWRGNRRIRPKEIVMRNLAVVLVALASVGCNENHNKSIELMNSGVQKYNNHIYDSAERDFQAAIQTDPTNVLAHYN